LHVTEIVQLAKQIYDVQLDRDSIVSAILKKVKAGKTFIRTAPNTFALKTYITREGRGIMISKEAGKMPGVKKLHQESDNSGKTPYHYSDI